MLDRTGSLMLCLGLAVVVSQAACGDADRDGSPCSAEDGDCADEISPRITRAGRPSFVTFESGQVRPLALSPDGTRLFAANTPDGRLEVFDVTEAGLSLAASIPVGLEPVAVAALNDNEVWVVNHLSDSVSIIDVAARRVKRTLLVGDEPRDVVFARDADGRARAFVTTAHRGQQRTDPSIAHVKGAGDPELTTPGVGRADVWIFDTADLDGGAAKETLGGVPSRILSLFGDTPRALAVQKGPEGDTVYAAVFHSGNQTTTVFETRVCDGFTDLPCVDASGIMPGGLPGPATNYAGVPAVETGLIVRFNPETQRWEDELSRDWSASMRFSLPDEDVFAIDATSLKKTKVFSGVGTVLFNLVSNPATGKVYASNSEARNEVRFSGPGTFVEKVSTQDPSTTQGHLHEMRVTVLDPKTGKVIPRHLNPHIDYSVRPAPPGTKEKSLSIPLDMAISSDGKLYVAAFGSQKVGVIDTAALESGSFDPAAASKAYLDLSSGGPSGLALDEARNRLYVLQRFDNSVAVIDLESRGETQKVALFNPEPAHVVEGRRFLYDAQLSSSNGEASCASCHVFGDMDSLAWDLGDPDGDVTRNPLPIGGEDEAVVISGPRVSGTGDPRDFNPMKGPMVTQTLRGMVNHGAMHWRGDRNGGPENPFDSKAAFESFIEAFEGLLGKEDAFDPTNMEKLARFALDVTMPPNPNRHLDNSLTPAQAAGRDFFDGPRPATGGPDGSKCIDCHRLDPAQGYFGTAGAASVVPFPQVFKIPQLRNLYQKLGMFGLAPVPTLSANPGDAHLGDQVRGFGYLHDGSNDTIFHHTSALVFSNTGFSGFDGGDEQRREVEQWLLAFDTDLAPIVGHQVTLSAASGPAVHERVDLLIERSGTPFVSKVLGGEVKECDLVVKGSIEGQPRGWLYLPDAAAFRPDDGSRALTDAELRALAESGPLTYTCVPPGSGERVALDRDQDGHLDASP